MLEYVPEHWKVIQHVRPKMACAACSKIVQADAPSRPIARGLAGTGLLTRVLVSKYCDHLPLYRQSEIYARSGVHLERSTLIDTSRRLSTKSELAGAIQYATSRWAALTRYRD
jgi:transposase